MAVTVIVTQTSLIAFGPLGPSGAPDLSTFGHFAHEEMASTDAAMRVARLASADVAAATRIREDHRP